MFMFWKKSPKPVPTPQAAKIMEPIHELREFEIDLYNIGLLFTDGSIKEYTFPNKINNGFVKLYSSGGFQIFYNQLHDNKPFCDIDNTTLSTKLISSYVLKITKEKVMLMTYV